MVSPGGSHEGLLRHVNVFWEMRIARASWLPWWWPHSVRPASYMRLEIAESACQDTPGRLITWAFLRNRSWFKSKTVVRAMQALAGASPLRTFRNCLLPWRLGFRLPAWGSGRWGVWAGSLIGGCGWWGWDSKGTTAKRSRHGTGMEQRQLCSWVQ